MRCAAAATDQHREAIEHDEAEDDRIEPWARDDPDALLPRKRVPADAAPVTATARVAVSVESSERRIHPFPLEAPPRVIGGELRLLLRLSQHLRGDLQLLVLACEFGFGRAQHGVRELELI